MICVQQAGSEETLASSDSFIVTNDNGFEIYSRYFTRATTAAFSLSYENLLHCLQETTTEKDCQPLTTEETTAVRGIAEAELFSLYTNEFLTSVNVHFHF